jgi:hypothetical protein
MHARMHVRRGLRQYVIAPEKARQGDIFSPLLLEVLLLKHQTPVVLVSNQCARSSPLLPLAAREGIILLPLLDL